MENDIVGIINPYASLLSETISNNIIDYSNPKAIENAYNCGMINGVMLDNTNTPYAERKFARYNFDFLKDNQEDNQSIYLEDTKYYGQIKGSGEGKRILHYKPALEIDKTNITGAQIGPDCVSWALRTATDLGRCLRIANGVWEEWICRQNTACLYSGRGHNGAGADPIGLSAWAVKMGTALEKIYETSKGKYDFTNYKNYYKWGASRGRIGIPADLLAETKPYKMASYKVVKTTDALLDAMANGCTVGCGSMLSVESYGDPISKRTRKGWNHELAIIGCDNSLEFFKERIWIFSNSWGNWNKVTNIPDAWKPWPQGAFAVTDSVCQYALSDGGTTCFIPQEFFPVKDFSNNIV